MLGELLNLAIGFDTDPIEAVNSVTGAIQVVVLLLSVALLLAGLVGLYISVAEVTGGWGLVGFLIALVGTGMVMGVIWDQTFTVPALAQIAPTLLETDPPALVNFGFIFSFALFSLGWLLFGIAAYRAQVFTRIAVILLMMGAILSNIPLPFTAIIFAVAVSCLVFALLTGRSVSTEQPLRLS